jgi:radical SAM superfamily enzyme YgiQ (UPF0313 family)
MGCEEFPDVGHFFVGEAEDTVPKFLADLEAGQAKKIYRSHKFPDMAVSPVPLWSLVDLGKYASTMIQGTRGCPFKCDFCNIAAINGRVPRSKSPGQFLLELDAIYQAGFRGAVFIADDNFIGNKRNAKALLRAIITWQKEHRYPFNFTAEVDITLADDRELMDLMAEAGIKKIFLGLETPNEACLRECGKLQNTGRDLVADVKNLHRHRLITMSGFMVGFDNDQPDTFAELMIDFIQKTVVVAMVGVLQAIPGTKLYDRLGTRILNGPSGNNTDAKPNFEPIMPVETLVAGYRRIVQTIYSPRKYYERIREFLREYKVSPKVSNKLNMRDFLAFIKSAWIIGFFGGPKTSYYYWKTLLLALFKYPSAFSEAVALQIYGVHFQDFAREL